jgi:hypothetical protein
MKTKVSIIFLLLACQVLFVSCANTKSEPQIDNVEADNINNQVHAKVYELMNTLETVNPVILEVQSFTPNTIVFKNNFSVRIFKQTNGEWKEIQEKPTTRLPDDDVVFSPDKGTVQIFTVFPDLDDYTHNVQLRIYVIGDMQTDQGTIKVAAYADVTLHP